MKRFMLIMMLFVMPMFGQQWVFVGKTLTQTIAVNPGSMSSEAEGTTVWVRFDNIRNPGQQYFLQKWVFRNYGSEAAIIYHAEIFAGRCLYEGECDPKWSHVLNGSFADSVQKICARYAK